MNADFLVASFFIILALIIGFMVVFRIWVKNKERMAIIEKGVSGEDLKYYVAPPRRRLMEGPARKGLLLKWAIGAIGIGAALIIGAFIDEHYQGMVTFGLVFLLPGLGWVILSVLTQDKNETV